MIGPKNRKMMKIRIAAVLVMAGISSFAQKPDITSVDRMIAGNQEIVTIKGSGFGIDHTKVAVFFGASKGTVNIPISDQLLEVMVPAGATYDKISVTNLTSGLTAYTRDNFLPSFGGEHGFGPARLEGQRDFQAPKGLYDLCLCDFNSDGKNDIATANEGASSINIFTNNTSTPGLTTISFATPTGSIFINSFTLHITCGDLNGDGKPDIVLSQEGNTQVGNRIYLLQNTTPGTGTPTFSLKFIEIPGKKMNRTKIADLDGDGKPELIVSHSAESSISAPGTISVLVNQSTTAAINFATTRITYTLTGLVSTSGLAVDDLNGDGLQEIITFQYQVPSPIAIIRNNSTPGNVALGSMTTIPINDPVINVRVGDLDNDTKPDIAVTFVLNSSVIILRNQSSGNTLSFAPPVAVTTEDTPYGLDFGDLDGDGKTDIVVAAITKNALTILNNESTPGNLSFQTSFKPTTHTNRHLSIGDIDGDAKPDIVFTSIDFNGVDVSKVSILRNKSCVKPKITPEGPLNVCANLLPLKLTSSTSSGATYEWKNNGTPLASGTSNSYNVTAAGNYNYTVTMHAEGGACSLTSAPVKVDINVGGTSGPANPGPVPLGPVCIGSTLNLSADGSIGATDYKWTGPNNYTGSGATPAPIPNFQLINVGRYFLDVYVGSCIAERTSTVIEAIALPEFRINTGGANVVCPPATKTLSVADASGFTYQWFKAGSAIPGADKATYSTTTSGEYHVEATYTGCTAVKADPVTITFATAPQVAFTMPSPVCVGQNVTFTNQSTTDSNVTATAAWEFGDGNTSTDGSPVHKYAVASPAASPYNVKLTVSYNGACAASLSKTIAVQSAPAVNIGTPGNKVSFCPGDSLRLEVSGTSFTSYKWSTNETTPFIYVKNAGTYTVDVTTATCTMNAFKEIKQFEEPEVTITADPREVAEGQSALLTASGLQNYLWEPAETLSSATVASTTATPLVNTTYTVKGTDANGCRGQAVIEIIVRQGSIYSKITPSKFFSPDNGDEVGRFWQIERIEEYPGCQVSVYDEKGIKVHDAKPYQNNWDGTFNGRRLPDGVYYFIIKCEGENNKPKTGSITLLR